MPCLLPNLTGPSGGHPNNTLEATDDHDARIALDRVRPNGDAIAARLWDVADTRMIGDNLIPVLKRHNRDLSCASCHPIAPIVAEMEFTC